MQTKHVLLAGVLAAAVACGSDPPTAPTGVAEVGSAAPPDVVAGQASLSSAGASDSRSLGNAAGTADSCPEDPKDRPGWPPVWGDGKRPRGKSAGPGRAVFQWDRHPAETAARGQPHPCFAGYEVQWALIRASEELFDAPYGPELVRSGRLTYAVDLFHQETARFRVRLHDDRLHPGWAETPDSRNSRWSAWSAAVAQPNPPHRPPIDPPPGRPAVPTSRAIYLGAVFAWTAAPETRGRPVHRYQIQIEHPTGTVFRGASADVREQRYYTQRRNLGKTVRARVRAKSASSVFGPWSPWSQRVTITEDPH